MVHLEDQVVKECLHLWKCPPKEGGMVMECSGDLGISEVMVSFESV